MKNAMPLVKISLRITKDVKIQDGRQSRLKKSFSVLGKQQDTQIMKFNSPTHLICNIHLLANFSAFIWVWL